VNQPVCLGHRSQVGRIPLHLPTSCPGTRLVVTFDSEIAEVRQAYSKQKTLSVVLQLVAANRIRCRNGSDEGTNSQILVNARFATRMNRILVPCSAEEITVIFLRQNPNCNNEGGKKSHLKC